MQVTPKNKCLSLLRGAGAICDHLWNLPTLEAVES